jgi:primosomal protein N'
MKILFIHCRRGLYQLTKCKTCGHTFECKNCDAKLVTYRQYDRTLELVCHQCQTYYKYPNQCPECKSSELYSRFGGIEELVEILQRETELTPVRLDKAEKVVVGKQSDVKTKSKPQLIFAAMDDETNSPLESQVQSEFNKNICISDRQDKGALVNGNLIESIEKTDQIYVHTRIFDPSIPYSNFDQIIFVQAENLLASADYLVAEEMIKALAEVILQVDETTQLIFDTNSVGLEIFQGLAKLHFEHSENISVYSWYLDFLEKEKLNREKFGFPPFKNLLLITTQEKSSTNSLDKLKIVNDYLISLKEDLPGVSWSSPYPAKFLKRRNMYSHHILIRYPRQYGHFNLLRKHITQLGDLYNLQLRLNPRHLF